MSAGVLASVETRAAGQPHHAPGTLTAAVSVDADRPRLFQVLTVAEYMEAWLSIPGFAADSHLAVTTAPDRFRIEHFRSRQVELSITAVYRTCRRGKLQFAWHKETRHSSWSSFVHIRLEGDFGKTIVSVAHSRLRSGADFAWHQSLWERSLHRLRSLF